MKRMSLDRQRNLLIIVVVVAAGLLIGFLYSRHSGASTTVPDQFAKIAIPASLKFESDQHTTTSPQIWTYNYRTSDTADQVFSELKVAFQKAGFSVSGSTDRFFASNGRIEIQSNLVTQSSPEHTVTILAEEMP